MDARRVSFARLCILGAGLLALAGCGTGAPAPEAEETDIPDELTGDAIAPSEFEQGLGTPMEDRVATIGLINKRNNISRDIEISPGEARRIDDVIIRLSACERTAPWENPPLTGAFVQVLVQERADSDADLAWHRVFSGWMYKETPGINVVEHPVYDVWLKDCAMSFPGEEDRASAPSSAPAPSSDE